MVACSQEVLIDYGTDSNVNEMSIDFGTNFKTPGITKSIISNIDSLQKNKFGVFAHIADYKGATITLNPAKNGFFIYDDTLFYSNPKWALENNKHYFWPKSVDNTDANDPVLDFYAFGPRNIESDNGGITLADSVITVHINAIEKDDSIKDLGQTYVSNNGVPKTSTDSPKLGQVKFNFAHKMSWIVFEAKCDSTYDTLIVDSVKVVVDKVKADFVINTKKAVKDASLQNLSTAFTHKLDTLHATNAYRVVGSFVALPQTVSNAMTATIYYHYVDINGDKGEGLHAEVGLNAGVLHEEGTVNHSANTGWTVGTWEAGYEYIYRIHFKLREIEFTATVNDWNVSSGNNQGAYLIY